MAIRCLAMLLPAAVALHCGSECPAEEASVSMLQVRTSQQDTAGEKLELSQAGSADPGSDTSAVAAFDCTGREVYCEAPFNCNSQTQETMARIADPFKPIAVHNKTNLLSWCGNPTYQSGIVDTCLAKGSPSAAGYITYDVQKAGGALDADASYCFIEDFCRETRVSDNTTIADAEALCDERYGDAWRTHTNAEHAAIMLADTSDGWNFLVQGQRPPTSRSFAMLACAMGNFHCDVLYCKETLCNQQVYQDKYLHWQPKA